VGINCVVTRHNFDALGKVIRLARTMGLVDVEFLRIKPSGRGHERYHDLRLSPEQALALIPRLRRLGLWHRMSLKLDCSFTPFVCAHQPPKRVLDHFAILGCDAGNWLVGVAPDGRTSPCSFMREPAVALAEAAAAWHALPTFEPIRKWRDHAPEPCRSCTYLDVCKGGCRAVSEFLTGSALEPDPECPRVVAARST
jgi:radical SAM protein with 4Fe4S-binding SPASM domain